MRSAWTASVDRAAWLNALPDWVRATAYAHPELLLGMSGVYGIPEGVSPVKFSNDAGKKSSGGTCFGDSGGPVFDGATNVIVAVTSFGISPTCTGTDGG